ncbi:MAG: T9SS type A sorting domain-containing protein, partial [Ignavibacteriaceae bacterium]
VVPTRIATYYQHAINPSSTRMIDEVRISDIARSFPSQCLVAYYPFNDNANDESGNNLNGNIIGNPQFVQDRFGNSSSALSFDGIDDWIEVNSSSLFPSDAITICYWLNRNGYDITYPQNYISKEHSFQSNLVHLTYIKNRFSSGYWLGSPGVWQNYRTNYSITDLNEWVFYVLTYDNNTQTAKSYVNGILDSTVVETGDDQTVNCGGINGTEVKLDGSGSFDPDGDDLTYSWTWDGGSATGPTPIVLLPSGTTTISLIVNDGNVDSEPDEVNITVEDNTPPEIIIGTEMLTLWPANHKYATINLSEFDIEVADGCDDNIGFDDLLIISVGSDEEENGRGDGNKVDDMVLVNCQEVKLRKERSGKGNGRVYSINIAVTDNAGNTAIATCYVTVPHNKKKDAIDDGIAYSIYGCVGNSSRRDYAADNEKENEIAETITNLHLAQNYPNPFNPSTSINYNIPESGFVTLKVYDVIGKVVANLVSENKGQGSYNVTFDASNLPSGIYVYQLKVNSFIETKKMILLK